MVVTGVFAQCLLNSRAYLDVSMYIYRYVLVSRWLLHVLIDEIIQLLELTKEINDWLIQFSSHLFHIKHVH